MESSLGSSINQTFGNTEVTNGSHSFQGTVTGDLHLHSNISGPQNPQSDIFDSMPQAAFNSARRYAPDCLPGTRKAVLEQIRTWANGDETPRVYWLEGMAGTGKSTIALTVAREQYENHRLGASFFFSRGGGGLASARYFPATIAAQLKEFSPELKKCINDAAAANPEIPKLMLYDQWKKLVIEPLSLMRDASFPHPLLIVIDALDECDDGASYGETTFSALVQCLRDVTTIETVEVRVFVSSRPNGAIKLGFERILNQAFQGLILHNIEQSIVDEDLTMLYKTKLEEAVIELNQPGLRCSDEAIKHLVEKSHGLFIHAATICRFIRDGGPIAHCRLSGLLAAGNKPVKPEMELDQLYITVLESSLTADLEPEERLTEQRLFCRVIGSIVILFDVMTVTDLAMMLKESNEQVLAMISRQRSVIDVPKPSVPIRLLHPSFRDFLLDSTRCLHSSFSINPKEAHGHLFRCCLQLMKEHLRRNMCRSSQPATNARQHISKSDMEKDIPVAVQYASCYWIHHLRQSAIDPTGDSDVLEFFQYRFLYWLEALALVGRISDGVSMIQTLEEMATIRNTRRNWLTQKLSGNSKRLYNLRQDAPIPLRLVLSDAKRFLRSHISTIEIAPLQLYSSALIFSPASSITQQRYRHEASSWTLSKPGLTEEWGQHLQRLKCPSNVNQVAFSQDGSLIAIGLENGDVHLWETVTGTEPRVLSAERHITSPDDSSGSEESDLTSVASVAFSPDGRFLAIGIMDNGVSLWNLTTLNPLRSLETSGHVTEVMFSPSGNLVASSSSAVYIWDVHTGAKLHTLEHSHSATSLAGVGSRKLSIDCTSITSHIELGKIEIQDIMTGATQKSLEFYSKPPRGKPDFDPGFLSRFGWDRTTIIRQLSPDGNLERRVSGAFQVSPDGNLVAFGLHYDSATWAVANIATGKRRTCRSKFAADCCSSPVFAFSLDSKLIAVARGIRIEILHTATWEVLARLQSPDRANQISTVSFSPNGKFLISGFSAFGLVCLWDITTFKAWHFSGSRPQSIDGRVRSVNGSIFQSGDRKIFFWDQKAHKARAMKGLGDLPANNALSLDGKLVASGFRDKQISLYDTRTGALRQTLKWKSAWFLVTSPLEFSPNGKLLATAPSYDTFFIWDTTTGRLLHEVSFRKKDEEDESDLHDGPSKLVFSPDNKLIASGCYNGDIFVWEIEKDMTNPKIQFNHGGETIGVLAFSPDSKLLLSACVNLPLQYTTGDLCLWDTAMGMQRWASEGSSEWTTAAAFSSNGELIASKSIDGKVKLLDAKSGTIHHTLATGVSFSGQSGTSPDCLFSSGTDIMTDRGVLPLPPKISESIFVSGDWIMLGGERIVYLHPDYRDSLAFVFGDVIGFLDSSNQVRTCRYNRS